MNPRSLATLATLAALACSLCALPPRSYARPAGEVIRVHHHDPARAPSRGPANALVTIELFFAPSVNHNLRLPAFRRLEELQRRHPTRIRIIYRVVRRGAQPPGPQLPTLALEAYAQGRFFEFVGLVHAQRTTLTRDQMLELGVRVGLDGERADRAITEDRYRGVLDANERRLDRLRGTTAPMVFFNQKQPASSLSSMGDDELEAAYAEAHERARELIDKGIAPHELATAFDAEALQVEPPVLIVAPPTEDEPGGGWTDPPLAVPPLDLVGLPWLAPRDVAQPVPVILLCRPDDVTCSTTMRVLRRVADTFRGEVRLVWAPWFDVTQEDAAELALLGDAALCAEQIGSNPDDLEASPGWQWVVEMYAQAARSRRTTPDRLIDAVAGQLRLDTPRLSACRARTANASLTWIAGARRAGITSPPAIVVGGRIYHGLHHDPAILLQLIATELAPGVLGRCATTGC